VNVKVLTVGACYDIVRNRREAESNLEKKKNEANAKGPDRERSKRRIANMPTVTDPNNTSTCGKCTDPLSNEDAVGCEGNCSRWFHKECAGITKGQFYILKRNTCNLMWMCPTCRDRMQTKQPKEDGLTQLRKDMMETNKRLKSQMEMLQEQLLKIVEDMMNRGPEARDAQVPQPHRSPVIRTTKITPPPPRYHQTRNRELKKNRHKTNQQRHSKRRKRPKTPRKGEIINKDTRPEKKKSPRRSNNQRHHEGKNQ
jgi:hypothetical protein